MSLKSAVFIFAVFLLPYVYMITRSFLEKQSATLIENARLLGRGSGSILIYKTVLNVKFLGLVLNSAWLAAVVAVFIFNTKPPNALYFLPN